MENTKIEYCDHTFSPWRGCRKVSPGCQNCFAERIWARLGVEPGGRQLASEAYWKEPLRWNKVWYPCANDGEGSCARVLVDLCDWLDPEVDVAWLARFLDMIRQTPNLQWLLLTKRPELWQQRMRDVRYYTLQPKGEYSVDGQTGGWATLWENGNPPSNVWMGVSVEDQQRADERIPALLRIPAVKRWVSVEPMLGPVDLGHATPCGYYCDEGGAGHVDHQFWGKNKGNGIDWIVVGGESARPKSKARPCSVEWIRSIVQQGREACVPVFVKQMSGQKPGQQYGMPDDLWAIKEYPTTSST